MPAAYRDCITASVDPVSHRAQRGEGSSGGRPRGSCRSARLPSAPGGRVTSGRHRDCDSDGTRASDDDRVEDEHLDGDDNDDQYR